MTSREGDVTRALRPSCDDTSESVTGHYVCALCGKRGDTEKGLRAHLAVDHKPCPTTTPEPHLLGEFPMSCYRCHIEADS